MNHPTSLTKSELDVAHRGSESRLACRPEVITVDRDVSNLDKSCHACLIAGRTASLGSHSPIPGMGCQTVGIPWIRSVRRCLRMFHSSEFVRESASVGFSIKEL